MIGYKIYNNIEKLNMGWFILKSFFREWIKIWML